MRIDIITLFPKMFLGPFEESIVKRAQEKGLAEIRVHNLRKWAKDKRGTVDDRPYGGGAGMILMPEPIFAAVESLRSKTKKSASGDSSNLKKSKTILLTPQGKVFRQEIAEGLSKLDQLILICGHYEGFDERVHRYIADEEISIGDYILTGGELPAMVVADAVVRLIHGVLDKSEATEAESFSSFMGGLLEPPQYTRPEVFRRRSVPKILLSGDHEKVKAWRQNQSVKRTKEKRPDLLKHQRPVSG